MDVKIEFEWDENNAYARNEQWTVYVTERELGSSTSFGASTWPEGVEKALAWAGVDGVEVWVRR